MDYRPADRESAEAVTLVGISKRFPGVIANQDVAFSARWGEVHALLGENGAGKTTLMSILAGLYRPDTGQIYVDGRPVTLHAPGDAIRHGIGMVYQHFKLVGSQTVVENLMIGLPGAPFRLNTAAMRTAIQALGERYHLAVDPDRPVWQLSVGEQQRVEILRVLHRGARIVVLDEPTAVLTPQESDALMVTLRQIASEGRAVILISHKLEEVRGVADRVTVLRGGRVVVGGQDMRGLSTRDLARLMVGSENVMATPVARSDQPMVTPDRLVLRTVSVTDERGLAALKDVSLSIGSGEILGVAGVAGNGQRELAQVVAGLRQPTRGEVWLDGANVTAAGARRLVRLGVAHIPEDRMGEGLVGNLPLADNAILKVYDQPVVAVGPLLALRRVVRYTQRLLESFQVARATPGTITRLLSGGQLQRFLLAREMALKPRVVVAVHPTRGLDVAATAQVQQWLTAAARESGAAVLLISEDLDEVLQVSDRVAVLYGGEIAGVLPARGAAREEIGMLMAGSHRAAAVA